MRGRPQSTQLSVEVIVAERIGQCVSHIRVLSYRPFGASAYLLWGVLVCKLNGFRLGVGGSNRVPAKAGKYIEVANKDKHKLQLYHWNGDVQSQPTDQRNLVTALSFVLKAYPGYKNSGTSSGACIKLGPKNSELYFSGSTVQYPL